jgi:nucleotide-binding universal stress UspA family protein
MAGNLGDARLARTFHYVSRSLVHLVNPPMSPRILVPIDSGVHGDELLRAAARFYRGREAHLTLLHVCETKPADVRCSRPDRSMVLLEAARQKLLVDSDMLVDLALTQGSAANEIARFARERAFDLIIIGEHTAERESLTDRIRARTSCAVLPVRLLPETQRPQQPAAPHASSNQTEVVRLPQNSQARAVTLLPLRRSARITVCS